MTNNLLFMFNLFISFVFAVCLFYKTYCHDFGVSSGISFSLFWNIHLQFDLLRAVLLAPSLLRREFLFNEVLTSFCQPPAASTELLCLTANHMRKYKSCLFSSVYQFDLQSTFLRGVHLKMFILFTLNRTSQADNLREETPEECSPPWFRLWHERKRSFSTRGRNHLNVSIKSDHNVRCWFVAFLCRLQHCDD